MSTLFLIWYSIFWVLFLCVAHTDEGKVWHGFACLFWPALIIIYPMAWLDENWNKPLKRKQSNDERTK